MENVLITRSLGWELWEWENIDYATTKWWGSNLYKWEIWDNLERNLRNILKSSKMPLVAIWNNHSLMLDVIFPSSRFVA